MKRLFPALAAAGVFLAISSVLRAILAMRADTVISVSFAGGAGVFGIGLLYDVVTASYLIAPFTLWLALAPDRVARTRAYRVVTFAAFCALVYAFVVLAMAEWLFWDEFGGRFNFIAVDYLLYTHEVIGNIWQSYPVGRILLALMLPVGLLGVLLGRRLWRASGAPLAWRAALGVPAGLALAIAATLQYVDSDLKNVFAADAANELSGNGAYEFFAANHRNELSYERHYATISQDDATAAVRASLARQADTWVDPARGVERRVASARPERRLNVVLVSVESLGAEFLGAYGNPRGLTPNLDRLARESLWFSRVYATGNRTVRGLEALSLALPPTPGQSIVRRPNNDTLFSLGSLFEDKGYGALFVYGGYGYFDNMNAFFDANDYRSVDRRDIAASRIEFENIWGVADEHLFDQVLDEIDREKSAHSERPVFVHVMTTSNHRPYTYPPARIDIPSGTGRDGAVKYSDYAIGRFIERARAHAWFDDTLFVITADHGASARGTSQIPLDKYLIPAFMFAPKHVPPQRVDRLMSQIDIAPTLLGVLGFSYYSKFFGRDVLDAEESGDRAFVSNYQTLGYLKHGHLALLQPKRKVDVYAVGPGGGAGTRVSDPALAREAIATYQTASFLYRNGLYRDEEQLAPEARLGRAPVSHLKR